MRADFWLLALFGVANGSALIPRQDGFDATGDDSSAPPDDPSSDPSALAGSTPPTTSPEWKPITKWPKFFSLAIDETQGTLPPNANGAPAPCNPALPAVTPGTVRNTAGTAAVPGTPAVGVPGDPNYVPAVPAVPAGPPNYPCYFSNYAIRLSEGDVIVTPYDKWFSPKLPLFIVDDDTKCYTVSKKPYELYVNRKTGKLQYAQVGWLPPDAIAISFYLLGDNPLRKNDPSSAWLSWPSTQGNDLTPWYLCPDGTGQFTVWINNNNFGINPIPNNDGSPGTPAGGPVRYPEIAGKCYLVALAALNASPWQYGGGSWP